MAPERSASRLVGRYLRELEHELGSLPPAARAAVLAEVGAHIAQARGSRADASPAEIQRLLDRVGSPRAIAREAGARPVGPHWGDALVPWLLLFGGLAYGIGWLGGVALLWLSPVWSVRDRVLGTVVVPGGLLGVWMVAAPYGQTFSLPGPPFVGYTILWFLILAPIGVAIHLNVVRQNAVKAAL
ncbi:MAG: HAAS signaling domain-containing protein [Clostridia bacterium]